MSPRNTSRESGFALILALLALVLLTTMGLALSNSTSVELQISSNQRWSEAARYNAEAGIEYGKSILMAAPNWDAILPAARTVADWSATAWTGAATAATGPATYTNGQPILNRATRNWESWKCDQRGYGMGYGVVYDDGGAGGPEEFRSQIGGATLNGAFTLWVRRPVRWNQVDGQGFATGTQLEDYADNNVIVLVSEGVAPFTGGANAANAFAASNRAVYTIETLLVRTGTTILDQSACSSRQGQAGGSSSGGNTSGCVSLTAGRQITEALAGTPGVGTGDLK